MRGCQVSLQRANNIFHIQTRNCTITLISVVPDITDITCLLTNPPVYTSLLPNYPRVDDCSRQHLSQPSTLSELRSHHAKCHSHRSCIRSFIQSFIHLFIHSFIHSFIQSFIPSIHVSYLSPYPSPTTNLPHFLKLSLSQFQAAKVCNDVRRRKEMSCLHFVSPQSKVREYIQKFCFKYTRIHVL